MKDPICNVCNHRPLAKPLERRRGGLTEIYTLEADKIPIGPEYGIHLVDYRPQDGPLR